MRRARMIVIGLVCFIGLFVPSSPQTLEKKLLPTNGVGHEEFGSSVAVEGDIAIVGARLNYEPPLNSGAAYVFFRTAGDWCQQSKLLPSDGISGQQFGISVAVDGRTTVIGAWHDCANGLFSGSAYVFVSTGGTWLQQAKLLPSDGDRGDEFGRRVAVDGHTIGIAAGYDDDNGADSGSAYIFVRRGKNWVEQAKLLPADGQPSDVFGSDIAVDGNTAIIGAALDDDQGDDAGSAYVFLRTGSTWIQQAKLLPDDGSEGAHFGSTVSLDGNTALIGAPSDDDNGLQSGSAYVFVRKHKVWTQTAKLLPSDGDRGDEFGTSVSLSGNAAAIGAPSDNDLHIDAGSVYLFVYEQSQWMEQEKIFAPDGEITDGFGTAITLDCPTLVSSSPNNPENGPNAGAAYVFRIGGVRCEDKREKRDGEVHEGDEHDNW